MNDNKQICLLSITASHYRTRIYCEMQKQMDCHFIFGIENTSVKRMDTSLLADSIDLPNKYLGHTNWYYQPSVLGKTKSYDVLINDLGIFCLSAWMLLIIAKFRGQKIYNWDHGWYGRENLIKKILKRLYFGLATGSFIYGDHAISLMKANGFNPKKLYAIHNSLDYQAQLEIRNRLSVTDIYKKHFGNENPTLIMIGRLNLRKKLNQLIEAVAMLRDQKCLYNIVIIGDGEDKKALQEQVSGLHLEDQVWFYGACYDETTNAEMIYNSDMCVVPGDIGLTAIHSMMFGVPVITHNYFPNQGPEFEVIKDGLTGKFFEHDNVQSLADAIKSWFSLHVSDRDKVRQVCQKEIDTNWTPQYQINILKKVIYG